MLSFSNIGVKFFKSYIGSYFILFEIYPFVIYGDTKENDWAKLFFSILSIFGFSYIFIFGVRKYLE